MKAERRRAQVLAEFAISLPLLLTLLFFLIECGFYLSARQGLHTALREGAVLAGTQSEKGVLSMKRRPALVNAMLLAAKRPGLSATSANVDIEKRKSGCLVVLSIEADYKGLTPLRSFFEGKSLSVRIRLPLGKAGA